MITIDQNSISVRVNEQYSGLSSKINWVIDTFNNIFTLNKPIQLDYGNNNESVLRVIPGEVGSFFSDKQEIPNYCFIVWDGKNIPILFSESKIQQLIERTKQSHTIIHGDVIMSTFYFLSCWQEYVSDATDEMGRFPFKESFLSKSGLICTPVVNYYFDILVKAIESVPGMNVSMNPKHTHGLKIGITHDIDQCKTGSLQDGYRQVRGGEWWNGSKKWIQRIYGQDLWFNFDQLLKIEKELDVTSSYYFITEKKRKNGYPNADYDFSSKQMQEVINKLANIGHEVGIHGSIGTGYDTEKLSGELSKFPNQVHGGRFHYLMMSTPESFSVIEKSGLVYDTSLGFAEHIGFRNGFCFPYFPYNFENETPFSFLEFPFQMMDKTLIQPYYMGLKPDAAIRAVKELIDEINKFSGYFIFIWHNNTITGYKYEKWKKVLIETIKYGQEMDAEFQTVASFNNQLNKI